MSKTPIELSTMVVGTRAAKPQEKHVHGVQNWLTFDFQQHQLANGQEPSVKWLATDLVSQ